MAEGQNLKQICALEYMPSVSTVFKWLEEDREFSDRFARARLSKADLLLEEALDIADTPCPGVVTTVDANGVKVVTADMIEHRKLRVQTRMLALAKLHPAKYSERLAVQNLDEHGKPTRPGITIILDAPSVPAAAPRVIEHRGDGKP